jgi:hypothetical protein
MGNITLMIKNKQFTGRKQVGVVFNCALYKYWCLRLFFALSFSSLILIITNSAEADITVPGQGVWLFDQDADGIRVHDSSVYMNDGTRVGSVTTSIDTPFKYPGNHAAVFDGDTGYISIPVRSSLPVGDKATVECWFKFPSGALQTGTHQIVGGAAYRKNFLINQSGKNLFIYWKSDVPTVRLNGVLGGLVDQWTHIAVTVSQGIVSVYLNGELQGSQAAGNYVFDIKTVNIGGNVALSGGYLNGLVDEVRILNYPLTRSDIMANYKASLKKENALPGEDRELAFYQTEFSPSVLLHATGNSIKLFQDMDTFGLGSPTYLSSMNSAGDVSVYQLGSDPVPADISESWILVWFNGSPGWDGIKFIQKPAVFSRYENPYGLEKVESPEPVGEFDVPWLIVLQHRPNAITNASTGIELTFEDSVGYMRMIPLYGIKRLNLAQTANWSSGLPPDVVQRSRKWARMLQMYPIGMEEHFSVDHDTDRINIRNDFEYLRIADDWDTAPLLAVPIPPVLGLVVRYGEDDNPSGMGNHLVSFKQRLIDHDYMTPYGPLYSTEADHYVEFSLNGFIKYANEVAVINGPNSSMFSQTTVDDLETRLADAVHSQYITKKETTTMPRNGSSGIVYDNWYEWEAFDWLRQGLTSSLIAKVIPYLRKLDPAEKAKILCMLNSVLDEYLAPDNYVEIRDDLRNIDYMVHKKRWQNQGWSDAHAFGATLHSMYILAGKLGRMEEISNNWDMIRKIWNGVQYQKWINFPSDAEGDHLSPMIAGSWALARMAARVGDQENYDLGVYSGAKFLLNRYATLRAIDYASEMGQWPHWMDLSRNYLYFSTRRGSVDRLDWASNTMGFKFFDTKIMNGFGWGHTFTTMLIEENYERFYHEKAASTAKKISASLNANAITETKLINGVTTESTKAGHWEMVSWLRDRSKGKSSKQVEVIIGITKQKVARLDIRSLSRTPHGIYYPSNIDVLFEDKNGKWRSFGSTSPGKVGISDNEGQGAWHKFMVTGPQVMTGRLKIVATLNSCCSNVGGYWFSDEIEVVNSGSEKITVESVAAVPPPNYLTRKRDWFAVDHMLTTSSKVDIYHRLVEVHNVDTPLIDNLWRTLHAGEDWPFMSAAPVGFAADTYWSGLDQIMNEGRSVGFSNKKRLKYANSSFAMLSKNYWDDTTPGWPLLSWYGFIAPQAPQGMTPDLQNLLPFGFVKPAGNVSPSQMVARIVRSSNLMGIYTVGDLLGEWPLNDGVGLRVNDVSMNGNDVLLEGASRNPSWYKDTSGRFVMEFDGQDVLIIVPKNDLYALSSNGYIECWIKFRSLNPGTHQIIGGRMYERSFLLNQYGNSLYVYWKSSGPRLRIFNVFEKDSWYKVRMANNNSILTAKVEKHSNYGSTDDPLQSWEASSVNIKGITLEKEPINIGGNDFYQGWTVDGYIGGVKICNSIACVQGARGVHGL